MLKRTLIVMVALLATTAVVVAQGGGGRGQGGGRGMMGRGGGGDLQTLQRPDVQKDLKITDAQKTALQKVQAEQQEMMRARMEEMRNGGGGGDREAMMAEFQKMQKATDDKVKAVLTKEQVDRLKQINIQMGGMRIVLREEFQKELGIDDAQKAKLASLQTAMQEANQGIMQRMRDQEIDRTQMQELMDKNNKTMDEEIEKVLTQAQKDKLKEMSGPKFEWDKNWRPERGGGN